MDAMTVPTAGDLIATIRDLDKLLRQEMQTAEHDRQLPVSVADECRRLGLFRMYRPRERGGFGFDPVSGFRVVEELSRIDSAIGWNVAISNGCECFAAYLGEDATEGIFGPADTVIAGGLFPPRKAVPVDGGYRISGKSLFNSNVHAANWLLVEAIVYDGDEERLDDAGNPVGLFLFVPRSEAEIIDNWDTLGMRGTGSHDVELRDVFVPQHHTAPLAPLDKTCRAYSGPLHRLGVWPGVAINAVPALGIAQASIDAFIELAGEKVHAYTSSTLRRRQTVQLRLGKAEAEVRAARHYLHRIFDEMWNLASMGEFLTIEQRADCQQAAAHAVAAASRAVQLIHSISGTSAIRKDLPFERYVRDMLVVTQHAFFCEARFEAVGQIRLGLDPDWEFLYF